MLSTLHSCSNLGVKNDLELFTLPPTQFSHEGEEFIEYYPSALKPQESDTVEFAIPNTGELYLDPSSIFLQIRAKILRSDGNNTKELPDDRKWEWPASMLPEDKPDKVYPCESFINSLFRFVDVYLNGKLISHHELYQYRSFIDLLLTSNLAMQQTLWPLMYELDSSKQKLDLVEMGGISRRYRATKGSKEIEMETPIFTDIAQQGMLLLPGVNVRIVFRQNPDKFRIITSEDENREYKLDISRFRIRARYVKIADSVRLAQEEVLNLKPALYLLRGVETRIRSLPIGSADIVLENLCPSRVPSKITIFFVLTEAFYGSFKTNPYNLSHLNMKKSSLFVGNRERREEYDFDNEFYATAYINFCRAVGDPHVKIDRLRYQNNTFMIHYNLTPDCSSNNLSPITLENVRLQIELTQPLKSSYTCVIMTETPRVLEIDKKRVIELK